MDIRIVLGNSEGMTNLSVERYLYSGGATEVVNDEFRQAF
jgi:hypothetical protein